MRKNYNCLAGLFLAVVWSAVSMAQNVPPVAPPADPGSCVVFLGGQKSCEDIFGPWIPNLNLVCNNLCPNPSEDCNLANDFEMERVAEAVYKAKYFWNVEASSSGFAATSDMFECYRIRQCKCTETMDADVCEQNPMGVWGYANARLITVNTDLHCET